jgi:hypothetical protein
MSRSKFAMREHRMSVPGLHVGHNGPDLPTGSLPTLSQEAPDTIAQQARKDTRP